MSYTAIVSVENGKITKYAEFEGQQDAHNHVNEHGGFVYNGAYQVHLEVGLDNSVSVNQGWIDEEVSNLVRQFRNDLMILEIDPIVSNPLRWGSLSDEQQLAFTVYRQNLLDIPQQEGFPHNVVWPTKPEV